MDAQQIARETRFNLNDAKIIAAALDGAPEFVPAFKMLAQAGIFSAGEIANRISQLRTIK